MATHQRQRQAVTDWSHACTSGAEVAVRSGQHQPISSTATVQLGCKATAESTFRACSAVRMHWQAPASIWHVCGSLLRAVAA